MGLNKYFLKYSKCIQVMVSPFLISCFYIFSNGHRHSGLSNGHPPSPDLNYEMGDPLHEGKEEETWGPSSKAGMELGPLCSPELKSPRAASPRAGYPRAASFRAEPPRTASPRYNLRPAKRLFNVSIFLGFFYINTFFFSHRNMTKLSREAGDVNRQFLFIRFDLIYFLL